MRSELLYSFFAEISTLKGVGTKLAPLVARHIGPTFRELLFFTPSGIIYRQLSPVSEFTEGGVHACRVTILAFKSARLPAPSRILTEDETGQLELTYFHPLKGIQTRFPEGSRIAVGGRVERFRSHWQMPHPDILMPAEIADEALTLETVYPASKGLASRRIAALVSQALDQMPLLPEWLDLKFINKSDWPSFTEAITALHHPRTPADIEPDTRHRLRLAYDEALARQLRFRLRRRDRPSIPPVSRDQVFIEKLLIKLPFNLTDSQVKALKACQEDLASGSQMNRLLQGDVGSGKTIIALLNMMAAAHAGYQSALMAPTEMLALQHYDTAHRLFGGMGFEFCILTGRDKGTSRTAKLKAIAEGRIKLVFGTHAIFQDKVKFNSLYLAVVDEQHRFGVAQRQRLFAKGETVHFLSMSATPIPRTLALTQYGDYDLSLMPDKPAGRQPIQTAILPAIRIIEVVNRLKDVLSEGGQAYWICPLVEANDDLDYTAVISRFDYLKAHLSSGIGLVHGRMRAEEKDAAIASFASGEIKLLCATTVVEVGIDVPNASIIIIEQAERFGLAQLHQLRGRVGRGHRQSTCLLIYDTPLSQAGRARLEALRSTEDGFAIAELDWKLRGEGDLIGSRQSGLPDYAFIDPIRHADLIELASSEADYITQHPDKLTMTRRKNLELLMQLFENPNINTK